MKYKSVQLKTKDTLVKAATTFRKDQVDAYHRALESETNPRAKWVLETLIKNADAARKNKTPLCDDTGIPHVFIEMGDKKSLNKLLPFVKTIFVFV